MVAIAQIVNVNFPLQMPGELISGDVTVRNVGDESTGVATGFFGVLVKTLWDNKEYTLFSYATLLPGESFIFYFHSGMGGIGVMPEGAAVIEVVGRTWLGEVWRIDDVVDWSISEGGSVPEPKPLMPLLLLAALALVFYERR